AGDRDAAGDLFEDDRIGADPRIGAYDDRSENFRAGADDDAGFQSRMALAVNELRSAERDALIERHVIADLGRLADDGAHAVIDENPLSDDRTRMNFDPRQPAAQMRNEPREHGEISLPETMRQAMDEDGMNAGIGQQDLEPRPGGRIALHDGLD